MQVVIREIGNSKGVVIPKPLLAEAGLGESAEMTVEDGAIVLRRPAAAVREGWAAAASEVAAAEQKDLLLGEFPNEADADLAW
ncbi:AbrB/MazE/SpoVT family DNA-binding domain-containing protein [Xylophilus sp.]|uniref:AbrB/MazE/SpoVT family DNA-binding domain-containing protein n=1 Tax=Xylophilus sp. TaxID=2653893 RepID=UPI0013BDFF2C|nr:AbrB/MazE/SpoVT family DNA-binding domain-containing protein [Xylophilus sp.]KAF1043134.1 MAG: hypothetical protein GAK38_04088 [Xylophilus sp.]